MRRLRDAGWIPCRPRATGSARFARYRYSGTPAWLVWRLQPCETPFAVKRKLQKNDTAIAPDCIGVPQRVPWLHRIASSAWVTLDANECSGANRRDFSAFVAQRTNNFRLSRTSAACPTIARDNACTMPDAKNRAIPFTNDNGWRMSHIRTAIISERDCPGIAITHQLKSF